jgi:hypothetical protein
MADPLNDFDRQMAEIDRIMAQGGAAKPPAAPAKAGGSPAPAPTAAAAPRASAPPASGGGKLAVVATWFRLVLAGALLAAIAVWPFANYCGRGLMLYLGAIGLLVITSLWALAASWTHRRGLAHVLGLCTLGGALYFGAAEVLPRTGYAKETRTWLCEAVIAPAPAAVPASPTTTGSVPTANPAAPVPTAMPGPSVSGAGSTTPAPAGSAPPVAIP